MGHHLVGIIHIDTSNMLIDISGKPRNQCHPQPRGDPRGTPKGPGTWWTLRRNALWWKWKCCLGPPVLTACVNACEMMRDSSEAAKIRENPGCKNHLFSFLKFVLKNEVFDFPTMDDNGNHRMGVQKGTETSQTLCTRLHNAYQAIESIRAILRCHVDFSHWCGSKEFF